MKFLAELIDNGFLVDYETCGLVEHHKIHVDNERELRVLLERWLKSYRKLVQR